LTDLARGVLELPAGSSHLATLKQLRRHHCLPGIQVEEHGGLCRGNARELKVSDRYDAVQSIAGGASYLRKTLANIPADIQDPDRTWYALAAYNLGSDHVEDARNLVRTKGGDPDKWIEIKRVLPLPGKPAWYVQTRFGKARGGVAVHYVNSIRRYYDLLVWITDQKANRRLAAGFGRMRPEGA
jgi:membrane-bound lytic murein transglycosylase F